MSEILLRITYLALGIYTFASALLTATVVSRSSNDSVDIFNVGGIWLMFIALVLLVGWASKATPAAGRKLSESFFHASYLVIGMLLSTCSLSTTMIISSNSDNPTDLIALAGIWLGLIVFACTVFASQQRIALVQAPVNIAS